MAHRKTQRNIRQQPVTLHPVKWISPQLWRELYELFAANYDSGPDRHGHCRMLDYEQIAPHTRVVEARVGDQRIGFLTMLDYRSLHRSVLAQGGYTKGGTATIWDPDRAETLNSRVIETVWVNHRYRKQGVATRLYQFAVQHMGATNLHIDAHRVWDRMDYFRDLGFTKCILYSMNGDAPSLKLHIDTTDHHFWELSPANMLMMFADRDMAPALTPKQLQALAKQIQAHAVARKQHQVYA